MRPVYGWLALGVGAVLVVLAEYRLNDYYQRVLAVVAINVILAVSLSLTNGFSGDVSLGTRPLWPSAPMPPRC